jgi:hypothetical protein
MHLLMSVYEVRGLVNVPMCQEEGQEEAAPTLAVIGRLCQTGMGNW